MSNALLLMLSGRDSVVIKDLNPLIVKSSGSTRRFRMERGLAVEASGSFVSRSIGYAQTLKRVWFEGAAWLKE